MSKPVSVVFCGQVRRPHYLKEAVLRLGALRGSGLVGEIVVSTWAGELDGYPGLREYLDQAGTILVEVPPIKDRAVSVGNVERQIVLLHWGMSVLGEAPCYVFKTRPDQPINLLPRLDEFFASLIRQVGPRDDADGALWVGSCGQLIPFFIDDRYFFGHRRTVERMTVFSNELVLAAHPGNLVAEVVWHSSYFVRKYRFLRLMMQADWSPPWPDGDFYPPMNKVRDQPFFRTSLALYYYILDTFYRVGIDGLGMADFAGLDPQPLRVEIPQDATYLARSRQQVFDHFDLWDDYRAIAAAEPAMSFAAAEKAFDACDAALLGYGKVVHRPRVSRPGRLAAEREAVPGDVPGSGPGNGPGNAPGNAPGPAGGQGRRIGRFPDGRAIEFDRVELVARAAASVPQHREAAVRVTIVNHGPTPLPDSKACPLKLGYKWFRDEQLVWEEFPRIIVGQSVADFMEIAFSVSTPPSPGRYQLHVDLLYDGLFWFDRSCRADVEVT